MDLKVERIIDKPADEVFAFFSDASNNPLWQKGMKSCRWTSAPPIAIGSTYEQVAEFMGRPIVSVFEVTALDPGASVTIETIESTFPIAVTRTVEDLGSGTSRVTAHISGGPGGLLKLLSPLTDRMAKKSIEGDYDNLVKYLA